MFKALWNCITCTEDPYRIIKKFAKNASHFLEFETCVYKNLPEYDEPMCQLVDNTLDSFIPGKGTVFKTKEIVRLASTLRGNHPGWKVLSRLVEHSDTVKESHTLKVVGQLRDLKVRLIEKEFTSMRPFVIALWLECRMKIGMDRSFTSLQGYTFEKNAWDNPLGKQEDIWDKNVWVDTMNALCFPPEWKDIMIQDITSDVLRKSIWKYLLRRKVDAVFCMMEL